MQAFTNVSLNFQLQTVYYKKVSYIFFLHSNITTSFKRKKKKILWEEFLKTRSRRNGATSRQINQSNITLKVLIQLQTRAASASTKNLPECLSSKEDTYSKDPLKFWFIRQRWTLGQANSPECSKVLSWVAALSVCRRAVDALYSEGVLENQQLILYPFSLRNLCKQPRSKHTNLTSQENTSATLLWRIKGAVGFFPPTFRDVLIVSEVG